MSNDFLVRCPVCNWMNLPSNKRCSSCDTPRDGNMLFEKRTKSLTLNERTDLIMMCNEFERERLQVVKATCKLSANGGAFRTDRERILDNYIATLNGIINRQSSDV